MFCASITPSHVVSFHPCLQVRCPLPNQTLNICESCEVLFSKEQIPHLVMILLALGFSAESALRCFRLAQGWCCFPLARLTNAIFHWQPAFSWQCHTVLRQSRASAFLWLSDAYTPGGAASVGVVIVVVSAMSTGYNRQRKHEKPKRRSYQSTVLCVCEMDSQNHHPSCLQFAQCPSTYAVTVITNTNEAWLAHLVEYETLKLGNG